jgi:hypothetical protein
MLDFDVLGATPGCPVACLLVVNVFLIPALVIVIVIDSLLIAVRPQCPSRGL